MTKKVIAIHSSRGGTGKTVIASNIAGILACKGYNVALFDFDFRAPSLTTVFARSAKDPIEYYVNDFLNGECKEEEIIVDISGCYNISKGRLFVGFANPSVNAIRNTIEKSKAWEVSAVKKLFELKNSLQKTGIDYCIFDTSPGIHYSSVNALAVANLSLIVTSADMVDLTGTREMLREIYDNLEKETFLILNKFSPAGREFGFASIEYIETTLGSRVISKIPCYCEVMQAQRMGLLALQKPDHPFVRKLEEVAAKVDSM
jgi:MinD-like ATPase involved in chromosome partitioning or flagellar assembly